MKKNNFANCISALHEKSTLMDVAIICRRFWNNLSVQNDYDESVQQVWDCLKPYRLRIEIPKGIAFPAGTLSVVVGNGEDSIPVKVGFAYHLNYLHEDGSYDLLLNAENFLGKELLTKIREAAGL